MPKEDASVDYYAILGVPSSATADEVRKQFKKLALLYHPDRNVGKEAEFNTKFQSIQAAHELLTDATRRRVYDRSRAVYRATTATTNGYSSNYRPPQATQARTSQPNGAHPSYFAKTQAAKEQAARAAQARAEAEARRQHQASAWAHRKQAENWAYGQGRNRREEIPRTPKKTRDNPYATDEYATRGSHTDEPKKESSGFFANRNPREKEWMHGEPAYGSGSSGTAAGARKFAAETKASEQPHSAPRPASTSYSFTPKQRVRMNLYEGAPRTQRSNDDFSTSSRGSPRMRSHAARDSPPQTTAQSNMHSRRKSSTSGIGSELNNSEGSRFTYLFNKDGPRGPARSARHPRPPEVEDDDDDDDDDFFVNLKNRRNAPSAAPPYAAKRQSSLGEEHLRGRAAEPRRTSRTRTPVYRDAVSPSTLSSSDSERESSVSPTPPSKPQADDGSTRPKARMRIPKARVDDASDVSSDSDDNRFPIPPRQKPSPDRGFGFRFKFDTSSSQENMANGVNTDPPTPPVTATMPPIFDFSASTSQPPDSNGANNGGQPNSMNFDPQAWMFSFANGQANLFEPAQSPRKMPANNRMHTSFDAQGPLNFSRPRPASMAHAPDTEDLDIPRFSSPELEGDSKRSRSEDRTEERPPPPAPRSQAQGQQHAPQPTPGFVFQASEWAQTFSVNNPFELKSKTGPGLGSTNGARTAPKNRKAGGVVKKTPVSGFPVPSKPAPQPSHSVKNENEKASNCFSVFAFAKTPSMQNAKNTNGTGASTPSDTGLGGGGLSGVSGVPSPMAMDLDTPNTSPPPKDKQDGVGGSSAAVPGRTAASQQQTSDDPLQGSAPESNPFEPDRSSRRTRSRSPKKTHKPASSTSVKSNTAIPRAATPPVPKHAAASSTNTLPRQKASSPKKARTRLSMDDLGAVPPFAAPSSTGGINGQWNDFADNLPFASQAAPHVNLSPPASPKKEDRPPVPPAPIAPGGFTELTDAAYRKYSNQMQTYQTRWNQWNEAINGHFRARLDLEVMACAKNQGLTGGAFLGGSDGITSDLNSINQAIKDFEEDQQIQVTWVATCKRHGDCLAAWKVYVQALENRGS